jgi:hypothetical protein
MPLKTRSNTMIAPAARLPLAIALIIGIVIGLLVARMLPWNVRQIVFSCLPSFNKYFRVLPALLHGTTGHMHRCIKSLGRPHDIRFPFLHSNNAGVCSISSPPFPNTIPRTAHDIHTLLTCSKCQNAMHRLSGTRHHLRLHGSALDPWTLIRHT